MSATTTPDVEYPAVVGTELRPDGDFDYFSGEVIQLPSCKVSADALTTHLGSVLPESVMKDMHAVSQLGLKEAWLGASPRRHNRWEHSKGATTLGYLWIENLKEMNKGPLRRPFDTYEKLQLFVGTALLLHDYGHLPFSHLFNEAIESINWAPSNTTGGSESEVLSFRLRRGPNSKEILSMCRSLLARGFGENWDIGRADLILDALEALMVGRYGMPWVQAIVNSPIDADKLDYLRFDNIFLRDVNFPIRSRLRDTRPTQWLTEFLSEQEVNHAGLLALHGKSAVAARDLWEERIFLYDRFYLSPEIRVAERMALEIVQQFLIRCCVSSPFQRRTVVRSPQGETVRALLDRLSGRGEAPVHPIEAKFGCVLETMQAWIPVASAGGMKEFAILQNMFRGLTEEEGVDQEYRDFLSKCFSILESLKEKRRDLRDVVDGTLVREPLMFHRSEFEHARTLLRPLQHAYCREALIDLVRLPSVLSAPIRSRVGFGESSSKDIDSTILVPDGPVSGWGRGQRARSPLSDWAVKGLEREYARAVVIAPDAGSTARARYVWDRVRSVLLDGNIELLRAGESGSRGGRSR